MLTSAQSDETNRYLETARISDSTCTLLCFQGTECMSEIAIHDGEWHDSRPWYAAVSRALTSHRGQSCIHHWPCHYKHDVKHAFYPGTPQVVCTLTVIKAIK